MSELEPLSSRNPTDPEWVWDSSYLDFWFPSEDAEFNVTALECWNYNKDSIQPSLLAIKAEKKSFPISMVEAWLDEPYPSDPNQKLSSGFKILVIPLGDEDVLPSGMSRRTIDLIHAALGLPPVYRHGASVSTGADGMFLQPDGTYAIVHRNSVSHRSTGVTLRYDPLTNVTQGVFLLHEKAVPLRCFDKLASQFCTCPHPLLALLAVLEASLELGTRYEMTQAETALREIELETGYDINADPGDNAESVPARTAKLRTLIRRLGTAQSRMFFCLNDFREVRRSMEFVQRKLRYLSASLPEDVRQRLEQPSRMLEERIEFLMSNLESALDYMALKERMETQQSVVFNLVAQMDGMVNIGLAKDSKEIAAASKRDSSAMKIVAVLTTFFLPGTFMATFFAMPLFDWTKASIDSVANKHFWIYWAVTGPLTVATVVGVAFWAFLQSRHAERLAQRARRTVGAGITGDDEAKYRPDGLTKIDSHS